MDLMQNESISQLITDARHNRPESVARLLGLYANYLKLVAAAQIDKRLQRRFSPSDVVQETLLAAFQSFTQFRGSTEAEFLGWLRQILVNELASLTNKHVVAQRRDVRRELSLQQLAEGMNNSSIRLERILATDVSSPSNVAERNERLLDLSNAIAELPPDYRDVLVLRHLQDLPFPEIALRMERSPGAVRMLWLRAIESLRLVLKNKEA